MAQEQQVDPVAYRNGMARYAGHVQVVTTEHEGVRRGVTVTAACSVSDNPPSLLVCLNRGNPNNDIFLKSGIFALNTLVADHEGLAADFAGLGPTPELDRFEGGVWQTLTTGAPVLSDARIAFDCRVTDVKPVSSHFVLFGEVVGLHFGPQRPALVYLDRKFRTL